MLKKLTFENDIPLGIEYGDYLITNDCERVISKNGNIGGFAYGNSVKQKLLEIENLTNSDFA